MYGQDKGEVRELDLVVVAEKHYHVINRYLISLFYIRFKTTQPNHRNTALHRRTAFCLTQAIGVP